MRAAVFVPPADWLSTPAAPFQASAIRRILVPTDFSRRETKTIERAMALARLFQARLTLLHIVDINDPGWLNHSGDAGFFMRQLRTTARTEMGRLAASLARQSVEVESLVVEGLPAEEIVKRAREFDLVVMGHPRRQPFWRLFSKQTIQQTLEQAECAILVLSE